MSSVRAPLGPEVLHGRDVAGGAEAVGPRVGRLTRQVVDAAAPREVVEGRGRLGFQDDAQRVRGEVGQLDRNERRPRVAKDVERGREHRPVLAGVVSGRRGELAGHVTDAHASEIENRGPTGTGRR